MLRHKLTLVVKTLKILQILLQLDTTTQIIATNIIQLESHKIGSHFNVEDNYNNILVNL